MPSECCSSGTNTYLDLISQAKQCEEMADRIRICSNEGVHYNTLMKSAYHFKKLARQNKPILPPSIKEWNRLKEEVKSLPEGEQRIEVLATLRQFCTHNLRRANQYECPVCHKKFSTPRKPIPKESDSESELVDYEIN